MSNPNNGATLEDCHTNFFALTDLCGIRWRRMVSDGPTPGPGGGGGTHHTSLGPLDDPVLSSYARCLAADILCVWRRAPNAKVILPNTPSNDPFHQPSQASPHFHPHHPHHGMMPPQLGMGGQLTGSHPHGGPPPYPHQHGHGHGFSPQMSPMHHPPNFPQQLQEQNNPSSLNGPKELWIFWYGEEPDLQGLVNAQLLNKTEPEQGSWESGLSYECRTLLFKALHNLIEKCLLARDFVRLGKWFIQPSDESQRIGVKNSQKQLSFSFAFFLHGESTVCMSVDVRQHPSVKRVNRNHLQACQGPNQNVPVILAPYGLAGTLTGVGYRLSEPGTHKILEEWKQFYPVEAALKNPVYDMSVPPSSHSSPHPSQFPQSQQQGPNNNGIPPVLEVLIGGVRMRYPACYVLVTEPEDVISRLESNAKAGTSCVAPKTSKLATVDSESAACPVLSPNKPLSSSTYSSSLEISKVEGALPERVWQEAILSSNKEVSGGSDLHGAGGVSASPLGHWEFVDPMKRSPCSCSKCKRSSKSSQGLGGQSGQSTKSSKVKRSTFHRRAQKCQVGHWVNFWETKEDVQNSSNNISKPSDPQASAHNSSNRTGATPGTPVGGPPSFKTGPGSISAIGIGSEGPPPSPPSVAPSPLPTPRSQPPSVSQQEPSMPTLSPQPSSVKALGVSPEHCAPNSLSHQTYSPLVSGFDGAKSGGAEQSNSAAAVPNPSEANTNNEKENKQGNSSNPPKGLLIRPSLPGKEYESMLQAEESCQPSDSIYDLTSLQAWLFHPVKRAKTYEGQSKTTEYNWGWGMKKSQSISGTSGERVQLGKRAADPYEFDDESQQPPAVNMDGLKRKEGDEDPYCAADAPNANKSVSGNLFTAEGLHPSLRDLDNLFDNSDTSSDETFQVPTPPGSNKPASGPEEMGNTTMVCSGNSKGRSGLLVVRPEELSKMFPTPPSHEPNPISSPIGLQSEPSSLEGLIESSVCIRRPPENYPGLGSPPVNEPTEILGSSKYASLPVLPSHHLPPLTFPPNSVYKPSWQCPPPQPQQHTQHPPHPLLHHPQQPPPVQPLPHQHPMLVCPNGIPPPNALHLRPGMSPISPSPHHAMRGAPQFDMANPPSNSMYLKQVPNAPTPIQHPHTHPQPTHAPPMYGTRGVEAHALVVNLSLSDSVINLFHDHNFDSCTMCVCNASNKVIGNIRGSEVGLYIQDCVPDEEPVRCNCGFSASVNRRLAHRSGLFYEDEYDITTASFAALALPNDEWYERKKTSFLMLQSSSVNPAANDKDCVSPVDEIPPYLLDMIREQYVVMFGACTSRFTGEISKSRCDEMALNILECADANRAALIALEHGRTIMLEARRESVRIPEETVILRQTLGLMHKWSYRSVRGPKSSQDVMQVMRALHPFLQDGVHSKARDAQYTVSGPLTWRQFHRLAGRGTDDRCEPQPIPPILVGSEKDWISLSPLAIKLWEKLLLEPYSYPRDIAYLIVAPDNDFILQKVRLFFREFSCMYEVCQLGRHCAISKVLRDGILRVGKSAATKLANEPVDEWFKSLPEHPTSSVLKLYAQVCRHYLAPQLTTISLDHSLFAQNQRQDRPGSAPKGPPPTIDVTGNSQGPPTPKTEPGVTQNQEPESKELPTYEPSEDDERDLPAVVVYLIDPFGFSSDNEDIHRLAKLGLLRCYQSTLAYIPENIRNNITLQIISLEDIINLGNSTLDTRLKNDQMRALALSVYSACRRQLSHQNNVKSLTGFGPAAAAELFLKTKDDKSKAGYRLYTPPYILAPPKEKLSEGTDWLGHLQGHTLGGLVSSGVSLSSQSIAPNLSTVLYVAYCLSEDQRWLLASVTDDRGELLETTTINIYVPNKSRRRKANARKHGLQKLMDFILGIMSTGSSPWRLVVGRLGRVGHGELEHWSTLLSRKSLHRASSQLKISCNQCNLQYPAETPCVLSACLVSLEADSCLRLMPDKFTPDERFSTSGTAASLSTPQDISCTHILVFPTSATTQSSQTAFQEQHMNDGPELGDDSDLLNFMVNDGIEDGIDGMNDLQLGDIFNWPDAGAGVPCSPVGSPRRDSTSQPGSPGTGASGRQSPFQSGVQGRLGSRSEGSEEVGTLLQQPLALGYFVSTAPSGPLPPWFWASCPHRAQEKMSAVFLKSALHLHSHSVFHNVEDPLQQNSNAKQHPLDSQFTTDVLRFVLEGYNALSWLALDTKTQDRRSCLPVHMQQLLQLYYAMAALV